LNIRYSVERCFEIAGEAIGRIARFDPDLAARIGDYPRIISFRNVLVHGYDLVDQKIVWEVIHEHLPVLKKQVEELFKKRKAKPLHRKMKLRNIAVTWKLCDKDIFVPTQFLR